MITVTWLRAFLQGEKIVFPDAIGVGLKEFAACGAGPHRDPSRNAAFAGVEPIRFAFDQTDNVRNRVFPTSRAVGLRAAHVRDVLVSAVAVRFVYAINSVVGH